ncbi:MAG: hypothetical protein D6732_20755 [Methanobacteriota archaeon]|nr:MAG: hypothetical protein D6732_20755 [Euryarchaeota archaeon]
MSEKDLFADLKHSLEHAKDTILDVEHQRQIRLSMVITDGRDDFLVRYEEMDRLAEKLKSEVVRVYLYELESTLLKDIISHTNEIEESPESLEKKEQQIIQALQDHSAKIKELKQQNSLILLEDGFKNLLFRIKDVRKKDVDVETLEKEDIFALTDFFLEDYSNREDKLSTALKTLIKEKDPQLIYCKPPLLRNRDGNETDPFGKLEKSILSSKSDGSWVYFEGNKPLKEIQKVACLIFGGQDEVALLRNAQALLSVFNNPSSTLEIHFIGLVPQKQLKMAMMVSEADENEVRKKIEIKMKDQFRRLRIQGKVPEISIKFGEIEEDLLKIMREKEVEMVFVYPKVTSEDSYDENAADATKILLSEGISLFLTY